MTRISTSLLSMCILFVSQNIQWFSINDLPTHKKDTVTRENLGLNPNAFFMVMPFFEVRNEMKLSILLMIEKHFLYCLF